MDGIGQNATQYVIFISLNLLVEVRGFVDVQDLQQAE